jgi:tol-pal system protein YbgF
LLAALPLVVLAGCAGGNDATQKQLEELRADLLKVRADNAAVTERLDALELASGKYRGSASAVPSAASSDRPTLDVVKLAPAGEDAGDDESGPRTVLRSTGNGQIVEEASAPAKADAAAAQRQYDEALTLYKTKQYDKAIEAFARFTFEHPEHANADNAIFWRGAAYFAKNDYRHAAELFENVVQSFPSGNKAPDALLQLSQAYAKLGDAASSDKAKKKLLDSYPKSDAAKKLGAKTFAPSKP